MVGVVGYLTVCEKFWFSLGLGRFPITLTTRLSAWWSVLYTFLCLRSHSLLHAVTVLAAQIATSSSNTLCNSAIQKILKKRAFSISEKCITSGVTTLGLLTPPVKYSLTKSASKDKLDLQNIEN